MGVSACACARARVGAHAGACAMHMWVFVRVRVSLQFTTNLNLCTPLMYTQIIFPIPNYPSIHLILGQQTTFKDMDFVEILPEGLRVGCGYGCGGRMWVFVRVRVWLHFTTNL